MLKYQIYTSILEPLQTPSNIPEVIICKSPPTSYICVPALNSTFVTSRGKMRPSFDVGPVAATAEIMFGS